MKLYNKRAFSLIELLVALSILAVVAAVIVPRFLNVRVEAAQTAAQSQQRTLQRAFAQYLSLGGTCPSTPAAGDLLTVLGTPASGSPAARAGMPSGWTDNGGTFGSTTISVSLGNVLNTGQPALTGTAGYYTTNAAGGGAWYCDGAGSVYTITASAAPGTVTFTSVANSAVEKGSGVRVVLQ